MNDWFKRLEKRCREMRQKHGRFKRVHMSDRAYHLYVPKHVWRPYRGSTDYGEMIINDELVEIVVDNALLTDQIILEF